MKPSHQHLPSYVTKHAEYSYVHASYASGTIACVFGTKVEKKSVSIRGVCMKTSHLHHQKSSSNPLSSHHYHAHACVYVISSSQTRFDMFEHAWQHDKYTQRICGIHRRYCGLVYNCHYRHVLTIFNIHKYMSQHTLIDKQTIQIKNLTNSLILTF